MKKRVHLFGGSDSRVASFVLWHFVEEAEHKRVAYDVYQAAVEDWIAGYARAPAGTVPLIDTLDPEIPVPFPKPQPIAEELQ